MDKPTNNAPCSPYLRLPLRTLDQARREHALGNRTMEDQADVIQRNNVALLKEIRLAPRFHRPPTKKAS